MKTLIRKQNRLGFTLIEMVGVLAVIAILAALLVPKIFAAINDSRFSNTVASINSAKTACMDYYGKESKFPAAGTDFGAALLAANYLERPLVCKVGTAATLGIVAGAAGGAGAGGFRLNGGTTDSTDTAAKVVQVTLTAVDMADAWELSKRIDGTDTANTLTMATSAAADAAGRVVYAYSSSSPTTTVYIYLAHK